MALVLTRPTVPGSVDSTVEIANQVATEGAVNNFDGALINPGSVNGASALASGTVNATALGPDSVRNTHATYKSADSGLLVARVPGYYNSAGTLLQAFVYTATRAGAVNTHQATIIYATHGVGGTLAFAAAPILVGISAECATDRLERHRISSRSATQIVLELYFDGVTNEAITISGLLYGKPSS